MECGVPRRAGGLHPTHLKWSRIFREFNPRLASLRTPSRRQVGGSQGPQAVRTAGQGRAQRALRHKGGGEDEQQYL